MTKETRKLRTRILLLALDLNTQELATAVEQPRETVSRVLNFKRPAKVAREKVAQYVGEEARQLIADELEEAPA